MVPKEAMVAANELRQVEVKERRVEELKTIEKRREEEVKKLGSLE